MTDRRNFIKQLTAAGILGSVSGVLPSYQNVFSLQQKPPDSRIWAVLLHLSVNMWKEYYPDLRFNESLWNDSLNKMVDSGMNMLVIDLGDAVKYESHPEIAVNNAWSTEKLHNELAKIRKMGLEPIPKMNFSTCHDAWLKEYGRMVSTDKYYAVCRDLISEVIDLFDKPRFFHLGMDEENESNQRDYDLIVIRQNGLYWGDLYFLIGEVEKRGSRPWVWQDYVRYYPEKFSKMMPKSVLQSSWCYLVNFDVKENKGINGIKAYLTLESLGYDQVPCGSNCFKGTDQNILNNVKFCYENVTDQRLLGYIGASWQNTIEENKRPILASIEQIGEAKKWFDDKHK